MAELKVADSEMEDIAAMYAEVGKLIETQLDSYFSSMDNILENSLTSGVIYENLVKFVTGAKTIRGQVGGMTKVLQSEVKSYVAEIDNKDEELY